MKIVPAATTPALTLPLRGREFFFSCARRKISFPLRGKVGMGVVLVRFISVFCDLCG